MPIDLNDPETKEYISKLRSEAAENRVRATEWQGKAQQHENALGPVTAERDALVAKFEQATKDQDAANRKAWADEAAKKYKLPEALAARLTGTSEAEFMTDAEALAKSVGPQVTTGKPPVDQHLTTGEQVTGDPKISEEARQFGDSLLGMLGQANANL